MVRIGQFARALTLGAGVLLAAGAAGDALAQQKKFSFAYDQPRTTAYGIAADIFDAKLKELSRRQAEHQPVPRRPARPGAG